MQKKEILQIKFEGETNINLKTLATSLNNLNDVIQSIIKKNKTSDEDIVEIEIKKIKEGSIIVILESIWNITRELLDVAAGIVTIVFSTSGT